MNTRYVSASSSKSCRYRKGFTLVEVLVTMAIVAVLSALSLSVFSRVRASAYSTTCQSNLKQIALSMQQYKADNNGYYPKVLDMETHLQWPSSLLPYLKTSDVFRCPHFGALPKGTLNPTGYFRALNTYNYNTFRVNQWTYDGFLPRHESAISSSPSTTWLNFCIEHNPPGPASEVRQGWVTVTSSCGRTETYGKSKHHSGGTNWSFLDGHVKWMTPEQLAEVDCANPPTK